MKISLTLLLCILCCAPLARAQRGLTPADTLRVAAVADAQIAPDGERVVYTVSTVEGNETPTRLWLARRAWRAPQPGRVGEAPAPLLPADWTAANPRWSPDGRRVAFLAEHDGRAGLWVINLLTSDRAPRFVAPVRATNFFITYADEPFAWSPDSRRIAYVSASEVDGPPPVTAPGERTTRPDPLVVDRIQYKSRTSFSDALHTHVWLVDVDAPAPRQLTTGPSYDHALAFSPRGDEVAFVSNHEPDPDARNNSDIFAVALDGRVRQLTNTPGCEYQPAWSPDGRLIVYVATKRDVTTIDSVAEDTHVWVIAADGSAPGREVSGELDRRATHPRWAEDSRSILFTAGDRGRTFIYRVGADGGRPRSVFVDPDPNAVKPTESDKLPAADRLVAPDNNFQVTGFSVSRGTVLQRNANPLSVATIAFTLTTPTHPAEVFTRPAVPAFGVSALAQVSEHNGNWTSGDPRLPASDVDGGLRPVALVAPEEFTFRSFDDTPVQGWLMKPLGWRDNQRYPLVLSIHGGPHGMYGYGFNAAFQAYAARGYAVLFLNPRGSTGYGQRFSDGTLREWGGGDFRDLMAGVDEALRRYSWLDAGRIGVTGGSYGGFMTNWIITQTPRFRAAVASASVSNLVSFYATSLYQDLIHAEFGGAPWDDFDTLWRFSPIRYVAQAQTPTLFIHGEQDNDVHITQAEEMYMALRRRNVETVFVRYPREGHGLREPRHRRDALERTLAWFDKYLR
ncbi:MAG TPA: S9 family peptidase [Pyrinomonadaceae bacterium]|jgi:dipeptidyl aminopeptidase/acylaminoacyl peptidase